jgi:hypothetical protein
MAVRMRAALQERLSAMTGELARRGQQLLAMDDLKTGQAD